MCKCLMIQQLSHSSCEIRVNFVLQPFNKSFKFEPKKFHYYLKRIKLSSQETIRCYFTVFLCVCTLSLFVCLEPGVGWTESCVRVWWPVRRGTWSAWLGGNSTWTTSDGLRSVFSYCCSAVSLSLLCDSCISIACSATLACTADRNTVVIIFFIFVATSRS